MYSLLIFVVLGLVVLFIVAKKKNFILNLRKKQNEKVLIEDALKHFYDGEYNSYTCTIESLSKILSIKGETAKNLIKRLEELGLIIRKNENILLTDIGKSYALKIVRIHRLLERYLAENTSVDDKDWHKLAEEREHQLDIEEANRIAVKLGNPLIDPHGDPIPTESGEIPLLKSIPLNQLEEGMYANIVHIEDEPNEIFAEINSRGLYPNMQLHLLQNKNNVIKIEAEGNIITLSPAAASNINVIPISEEMYIRESFQPLSSLNLGEVAEVVGLSKALRGQQRRRMLDFGIVPGTKIKAILESVGKDPIAYEIRGTIIALRKNQSDYVYIKKINSHPSNENKIKIGERKYETN